MSDSVRPHRRQPTRLLQSLGFSGQEHWSGLPFPSPVHQSEKGKGSRSVVSDSSRSHGLQPTRLLRPWDFPGKSTGVGCHRPLQHISNIHLLKKILRAVLLPYNSLQYFFQKYLKKACFKSILLGLSWKHKENKCYLTTTKNNRLGTPAFCR